MHAKIKKIKSQYIKSTGHSKNVETKKKVWNICEAK